MIKYRLSYLAPETGKKWHSKPLFNTEAMAQHTANEMNKEHKGIQLCWPEAVEVADDASAEASPPA